LVEKVVRTINEDDDLINKSIIENRKANESEYIPDIGRMMRNDIERCKAYFDDPKDEAEGRDLYTDITSRYDCIIPNLGAGLYQCVPEQHWYDPEISGETLVYNLKCIMNKMIAYQAINYSTPQLNELVEERKVMGNKVFIVHGHDEAAKYEMARTLEKGGFEAVILHEQPDSGLTIIEKIERYADVDFAVVLYTECDLGRAKENDPNDEKYRARQNVVFEHGYLIGKLGRDHVCALVKGNVETPGDISGVVYIPMDSGGAWKTRLGKNMSNIGMQVNLNTLCS
ncbi:MAG: nucleotide-binding protein, partial [Erysipelotrichaceae bacterium]|nr:nucleotide-binding protein [Erysipelotrichaceae bacterium]